MQDKDLFGESHLPKPAEVSHRVLRSRENYQIRPAELFHAVYITYSNCRMLLQWGKIRKVRHMRQPDHRNIQRSPRRLRLLQTGRKAVLVVDVDLHPGYHAEHRQRCQLFQLSQTRPQKLDITAELIDYRSDYPLPLLRLQQGHRAVELGKDTAPVNVTGQNYRCIHQFRKAHIYYIILPEIYLCGRARTLDHDDVMLLSQTVVGLHNLRDQRPLHPEVLLRVVLTAHLSHDDKLTACVA